MLEVSKRDAMTLMIWWTDLVYCRREDMYALSQYKVCVRTLLEFHAEETVDRCFAEDGCQI